MLVQANLPTCFWPFVVKHAVYVRNRVPHSATTKTPYFMVTGTKPNLENLRVFGCASFVPKQPKGKKFEARAVEGILLEVLEYGTFKVLICYGQRSYRILVSKHVTFDESRVPGVLASEIDMSQEEFDDSSWSESSSVSFSDSVDSTGTDSASETDSYDDSKESDSDSIELNNSNSNRNDAVEIGGNGNVIHPPNYEDRDNTRVSTRRYPSRSRKPPSNWFMSPYSTSLSVTTGDDPTLAEALNSTPEEREK